MGFWDIAGKVARGVWDAAQEQAARERKCMQDPRYREAKRNLREMESILEDQKRANRELDDIIRGR